MLSLQGCLLILHKEEALSQTEKLMKTQRIKKQANSSVLLKKIGKTLPKTDTVQSAKCCIRMKDIQSTSVTRERTISTRYLVI